jgi:uncharacterized DUF497 family protein
MEFEWDPAKRLANLAKHGLDFADVENLPWETMKIVLDRKRDYGEERYQAFGLWNGQLHVVSLTFRGSKVRIISFRRGRTREARKYGA